jgi:5-methylcytosine-specific restriction endonuclease McrBC regulatory subunit McrC
MAVRFLDAYEGEIFSVGPGDASFLASKVGGHLELFPNGVIVRRLVGHAVLPSGTVLRLKSRKAAARSILTWVAYCDPTMRAIQRLPAADNAAEPGDLAALTALLFATEVLGAAGAHGIARTYAQRSLSSSVVRGRIDFQRQACARGDRATIACIAWERTPETLINRWLATASRTIAMDAVMRDACAEQLPRLQALFDGIPLLARAEGTVPPPRPPRHLIHLEPSLALAAMLVRRSYLDEGAREPGMCFFVNLEALFEQTVARAFHERGLTALPKHPVHYEYRRGILLAPQSRAMQLDLFCPGIAGGLVVDAKYRSSVSPGNLQQMVTYCHLTGAPTAVLVLPAGHHQDGQRFSFPTPDGRVVCVQTAELRTDARSIADWIAFARNLVDRVLLLACRFGPVRGDHNAPRHQN